MIHPTGIPALTNSARTERSNGFTGIRGALTSPHAYAHARARTRLLPVAALLAGSPTRLLLSVWTTAIALYFFGPLTFHQTPTSRTWWFIGLSVAAFAAGGVVESKRQATRVQSPSQAGPVAARIEFVARRGAWLGLLGISCLAIDKMLLSGLDYSQSITALRLDQDSQVLLAGTVDVRRSPLLYIGYLTFGFSIPAYLICFLHGDLLRRSTRWLCHAALAAPIGFALLSGGRSPIVLIATIVVGAAVIRRLRNDSATPYRVVGRVFIVVCFGLFLTYYNYIFVERRLYSGVTAYSEFLQRFDLAYGATPSPVLGAIIDSGWISPDVVMSVAHTSLYFTHELPTLDRTLTYDGPLGPYLGQYQFYLISVLLERAVPSLSFAEAIRVDAQGLDVYGWFSTAWGSMYLDFGWWGALLATFVCGAVSARVYRAALRTRDVAQELVMCYVVAAILVSPTISVFTISISLPVLGSLLVAVAMLKVRLRQPRDGGDNKTECPVQIVRRQR